MRCLIVNAHESHVIKKNKLDLNETILGVLCIPGLLSLEGGLKLEIPGDSKILEPFMNRTFVHL